MNLDDQDKIEGLNIHFSGNLNSKETDAAIENISHIKGIRATRPIFERKEELAPFGDKETDALEALEVYNLQLRNPNKLLQKMLLGRTISGVSRTDDGDIGLFFSDGSFVDISVQVFGEIPKLEVSKEMYIRSTRIETVNV